MAEIRIVPAEERYADSLNRALDVVARERRYIGFLEGPPPDSTLSHASNTNAIALYRKFGFVVEGTKKRARKLDGEYDDDVLMALFLSR